MAIPKSSRFDPSAVLGSGCFVNIVTGARSFGKTYAFKKRGIKNYLERKETWCYLRTFDTTLDEMLKKNAEPFFSDVERNREFPGYCFRTHGRLMQLAKIPKDGKNPKWETFGVFAAITTFDAKKGATNAHMTMIVYDEFISEKGNIGYPPLVVDKLMNVWETYDRRENRTKIYMLANAADEVNPFFRAWNIAPIPKGTTRKFPVGSSSAFYQNAYSAEFQKAADDSAIGAFTKGTSYARYASDNEFKTHTGLFVADKPKNCRCAYTIVFRGETFGVWNPMKPGNVYITRKGSKDSLQIVLSRDDMRPDYVMLELRTPILKHLMHRYRMGCLFFDSDGTRELFHEIMLRLGIR